MLSRAIRFLWTFLKWGLLFVIVLAALLVLINWRDEPLSDEARALLAEKPVTVPDRQNIYVAMSGFDAQEGSDIFETGRKRIEEAQKTSAQEAVLKYLEEQGKTTALQWRKSDPSFDCNYNGNWQLDFLRCINSQKDSLEKTLVANATLIQRYRLLQALPDYAVLPVKDPGVVPAQYALIFQAQKTMMAQALLDMGDDNTKKGMDFFQKDMALWRQVLKHKDNILDSMIALASIRRDAQGLSLLLSSSSVKIDKEHEQEWRALLTSLSHEQYSLRSAFQREIKYTHNIYSTLKKWTPYQEVQSACKSEQVVDSKLNVEISPCSGWQYTWNWFVQNISRHFFQPMATVNYSVPAYKTWLELGDLSPKDHLERYNAILASATGLVKPRMNWIYNPMGKGLLWFYFNTMNDDYPKRMRDGDAYLRLVRLQLELRLAAIPYAQIPGFLKQLDEPYCAPCSDFAWNAQTHTLSFQPYAKEPPYFTASAYLRLVSLESNLSEEPPYFTASAYLPEPAAQLRPAKR